jgi:hypothetical protein
MEKELYCLSEVAEMLEIHESRLTNLLSTRAITKVRVAGWTLPEIAVIAGKLTELAAEEWEQQRRTHD